MKQLLLAGLLWALAPPALAQLVSFDVQVQPRAGDRFWLRVNYPCPPPGEAPPPLYCEGVIARIVTSDPNAQKPSGTVFVTPNRPLTIGPFKFRKVGPATVELYSTDGLDLLVAMAQFEVMR